jgi:hypothetical protein
MASWPSSLPEALLVQGYGEQPKPGTVRTGVDVGPSLTRPRFSARTTNIAGQVELTTTQAATLETFHDSTLSQGAVAFDWTHPRTGASVQMRFLEPPSIQPIGGGAWLASLSLEVLP